MTGRLAAAAVAVALLAGCSATPPLPPSPPTAPPPSAPLGSASPAPSPTVSSIEEVEPFAVAPGLQLDSVPNFRDVAGAGEGLLLADGSRMVVGAIFRSGKLAPISRADRERLVAAGVSDIYDLRTPAVIGRTPDPAIEGAERHEINVFAVQASAPVRPGRPAEARKHMKRIYREFVAVAAQRKAIAKVLKSIAEADGPVLVHCTEGKDRTGWISALLQLTAGADEVTVIEEYLLSNQRRESLIEREVAKAERTDGKQAGEIKRALLQVDASYLRAGLTELKARYGDLDGYLTRGLGLSDDTIDTLRSRLRAG